MPFGHPLWLQRLTRPLAASIPLFQSLLDNPSGVYSQIECVLSLGYGYAGDWADMPLLAINWTFGLGKAEFVEVAGGAVKLRFENPAPCNLQLKLADPIKPSNTSTFELHKGERFTLIEGRMASKLKARYKEIDCEIVKRSRFGNSADERVYELIKLEMPKMEKRLF
jgi:hypothetical protein